MPLHTSRAAARLEQPDDHQARHPSALMPMGAAAAGSASSCAGRTRA
ncbi:MULTISPECIES: hypothetical protein [unclassified Streptomyces]|uniref:Uncharacterized protein n=1 Tax=Streptomyces sp. NBC_00060 TaxID=2975636 RepID=A0AAU2HDZ9_9ACTN